MAASLREVTSVRLTTTDRKLVEMAAQLERRPLPDFLRDAIRDRVARVLDAITHNAADDGHPSSLP